VNENTNEGGGTRSSDDLPGDTPGQAESGWFQDHRSLTFPTRAPGPVLKRAVGAPERLFDWWFRRFEARIDEQRNRIVEAHDDGAATIVDHLRADGSLSSQDWDVYYAIADPVLPKTGWPFKLHYGLQDRGPLRRYEKIEAFLQRGDRGWADRDTFDLDQYLAGVIAGSLRHLARTTHGWPGEGSRWASPQAWTDTVEAVADDFDRLRFPGRDPEIERPAPTDVMGQLATLWPTLWD
jgi:hypothetical protein